MEYEVFLSFRGPDVRTNFADFLYKYLGRSNIRTFLDDEELRKGEEIAPSLLKAIEESKVYIPIISRGYASSKWCLQELAKMAECCGDRGSGGCHILLPIFYMVEPRDVRHVEEGSFVRAFQRHSDKYSVETVQEWRKALQEVGRMKGWHVTESDRQGAIIDQVFFKVWSKLRMDYMLVTDDLIGMDSHLAKMKELLQLDYKGVKVIGIHGMGGIGKTTIAKALYNEFRGRFDRCCFVEDVRETLSTKIDGVVSLQRKIVRNILQLSECKVEDSNEGIHIIKHAFGVDHPRIEDDPLSMEFVKAASCHPLSLKVIGSLLFRRDESFWKEKLKQLQDVLPEEVQERLRISYSTLSYGEQQIFLDIACFLVGEDKTKSFHMWNSCGYHPEIAVTTLAQRSLIKINKMDESEEFWMHDHLIDLGKSIVREEDVECPWKRSRIWCNEDALDILAHKKGTDRLKAIRIEIRDKTFKLTESHFANLSQLRYLKVVNGNFEGNFETILPNIRWLEMWGCNSNPMNCDMKKLVVFDLHVSRVTNGWIGWENIKVAHNLKSICLRQCNNMRWAPDLTQCVELELIDIRVCEHMLGVLHIGNSQNLKVLRISNTHLNDVTGDLGMLQNLQEITVRGWRLNRLPDGIERLSSLVDLSIPTRISSCNEPRMLPTSLKRLQLTFPFVRNLMDLKNLEEMDLHCYRHHFPRDMRKKLPKLTSLMLTCFRGESMLDEADAPSSSCGGLPSSLINLEIKSSKALKKLPSLGNLCNLRVLFLWETSMREIPGLGKLVMLETLKIVDAPCLVNLDGLGHQGLLTRLILEKCDLLVKLPDLSCLKQLQFLDILGCTQLTGVCGVENLECLIKVTMDERLKVNPATKDRRGVQSNLPRTTSTSTSSNNDVTKTVTPLATTMGTRPQPHDAADITKRLDTPHLVTSEQASTVTLRKTPDKAKAPQPSHSVPTRRTARIRAAHHAGCPLVTLPVAHHVATAQASPTSVSEASRPLSAPPASTTRPQPAPTPERHA
ncbi:Disease resistance protein L6 [Linum perenne]